MDEPCPGSGIREDASNGRAAEKLRFPNSSHVRSSNYHPKHAFEDVGSRNSASISRASPLKTNMPAHRTIFQVV